MLRYHYLFNLFLPMDQDTKERFDNLSRFLNDNMFTKADAEAMRAELADKEDISKLLQSMDAAAKWSNDYNENVTIAMAKLERMEHWIQNAAQKIGLEYKP